MLSYTEALERVLTGVPEPVVETVALPVSLGRVLAAQITADSDLPAFPKALMDGYALRSGDIAAGWNRLRVIGQAPAGSSPKWRVGPGEAVRIMTGAPVPEGADSVQKVESTEDLGNREVLIKGAVNPGDNMLPRGAEAGSGDPVLEKGDRVGPVQVGILATFGVTRVPVFRLPDVAILTTGDELVAAHKLPGSGEIRNSNEEMLSAQARQLGLDPVVKGPLRDELDCVTQVLRELVEPEVLVLSGGLSMGDYDYVHRSLGELGVNVVFHKAALKPGKPILFAKRDRQMIFGLPGNPVSSFVTFELFVRPAVRKLMGFGRWGLKECRVRLQKDICQKPGRLFFKPGRLELEAQPPGVTPLETAGSGDLVAFSAADCLIKVPAERSKLERGSEVAVLVLE